MDIRLVEPIHHECPGNDVNSKFDRKLRLPGSLAVALWAIQKSLSFELQDLWQLRRRLSVLFHWLLSLHYNYAEAERSLKSCIIDNAQMYCSLQIKEARYARLIKNIGNIHRNIHLLFLTCSRRQKFWCFSLMLQTWRGWSILNNWLGCSFAFHLTRKNTFLLKFYCIVLFSK